MSQKSYRDNKKKLYLVPTPLGNLGDMTIRAIEVLKMVDIVFCEDTRVTKELLKHFEITKKLVSCHEYNESNMVEEAKKVFRRRSKYSISDRSKRQLSVILAIK